MTLAIATLSDARLDRLEDILGIVKANPGATGAVIHELLPLRSWWARKFGRHSVPAILFAGFGFGSLYVDLYLLERHRYIRSEWHPPAGSNPYRRRVYYAMEGA